MPTIMLISKPKNSGDEYAGLPLKTLTAKDSITLRDGTVIPNNADVFDAVKVGDEIVVDGKGYDVERVSVITKGIMGKIIVRSQE